jgi:PIN domain nuclease of toxin-antitoxin system
LIDTHIAIWSVDDNPRLTAQARDVIESASGGVFVSTASIWEISIKFALRRKRRFDMMFSGYDAIERFDNSGFEQLLIDPLHAAAVSSLPHIHPDPFDRLLVAQAMVERMIFMTHDAKLADYGDFVLIV